MKNRMMVTKKRCTTCESEGALVNVVRCSGDKPDRLPASAADLTDIAEASPPYPCPTCGGPGFYFYGPSGTFLLLDELPFNAEVISVEGGVEWEAHHEGQPAGFIWRERYYVTSN